MSGRDRERWAGRSARRGPWLRRLGLALAATLVFCVGIALGQALHDGEPQPSTGTYVRTLTPLPQQPATTG